MSEFLANPITMTLITVGFMVSHLLALHYLVRANAKLRKKLKNKTDDLDALIALERKLKKRLNKKED